VISYDPDTGNMNWYFQFTPGDSRDYDEVGTHILIDGQVNGQSRKLITRSARNGFLYTMERANGAMVLAKPYTEVSWTKGVDQKTGKPVDYDPAKDIQTYAGLGSLDPNEPPQKVCPSLLAATTTGRRPTARRRSSSTSRRCRTARRSQSTGKSTPRREAGMAATPSERDGGKATSRRSTH
jgi:glucose dehydrogenase